MVPLQEVDVHTTKNVLYKAQIIRPTGSSSFYAEVVLHDSEFQPPFSSSVTFRQQFQDEKAAYQQVISWLWLSPQTKQIFQPSLFLLSPQPS